MKTHSTSIHWFDIRPSDLKGKSFEDLSEQFRSDSVSGLVCHLDLLDSSLIILLSPLGRAFTSCAFSPALWRHNRNRLDWGSLERKRAYAKELRLAGIRKTDAQALLLGDFNDECNSRGGGVPSLSVTGRYFEVYRLESCGFEKHYEASVRQYIEQMFAQMGESTLIAFPENKRIEDFPVKHFSFDYLLLRLVHPIYGLNDKDECEAMSKKVLDELQRSIARIEQGLSFDVHEEPICQIKRPVNVTCHIGWELPLTSEIISNRSRLLRLLAYPCYFNKITTQLPELRETWPVLSAGKSLPYDPIEELEAYLAEMLERYPVLGEDPFSTEDLAAVSAPTPAAPAAATPASPAVNLDKALLAKLSSRAIALKPRPRKKTFPPGASRFGGLPDLPATLAWPCGNHGPLGFLAQINCREAARFDAQKLLPPKGMLYFFYDLAEQPWGDSTEELADAVVLYAPDDTGLTQAGLPAGLDKEEGILPAIAMGFAEELILQDHSRDALAAAGLDEAQINAYFELYDEQSMETSNSESPKHRLLGLPDQVQNPMPPDCAALRGGTNDDWCLLLQLDSDETLDTMWGDMGRLYFWIRGDDLKRAHFAETCTFLQCH